MSAAGSSFDAAQLVPSVALPGVIVVEINIPVNHFVEYGAGGNYHFLQSIYLVHVITEDAP